MDEKEIIMDEKVVKEIAEFYEIPESEVDPGMYSIWEYQHAGNQADAMGFGIGTKHTFNNHEFTVKEIANEKTLIKNMQKQLVVYIITLVMMQKMNAHILQF